MHFQVDIDKEKKINSIALEYLPNEGGVEIRVDDEFVFQGIQRSYWRRLVRRPKRKAEPGETMTRTIEEEQKGCEKGSEKGRKK